ncbi:Arb2 domain-containing protein [Hypoxylon trugodes]|uniref:Arb2 domain-containing protein n=1 Tax=Hypoxylon trugodes TaxID=326681 RepID=UPI00219B4D93|nr:Arb2 domain-containing protein [Hypoxylon trugodes]KAI1392340.1 Arb2 domain-containing protein [Hypoxylon trugodes]
MFRRKWSGLPADPQFPSDLEGLGYFVNDIDEIRSIENPENYYKYFLTRNMRWNDRQRYAMNQAVQKIIFDRLEALRMHKIILPVGSQGDTSKPHVPIFISPNILSASRVVVIFGETVQDLGALAHRTIGGPGGITVGSILSVVHGLQKQRASATDSRPPGIILANMGEFMWSPQEKRTLTRSAFDAAPMQSAVHNGHTISSKNKVPGNEDAHKHVHYIFDKIIPHFASDKAGIDVLGVGDGADIVEQYLDLAPVWNIWKKRINCLALVGGLLPLWELGNQEFISTFLRNKTRAYAISVEQVGTVLSGPDGNPNTRSFTQMGCPMFSSGEPHYTERTLITSRDVVLEWLQEVALTPEGQDYVNPSFNVVFADPHFDNDQDWGQEQNNESGEKNEVEDAEAKDEPEEKEEVGEANGEKPGLILVERPGSLNGNTKDGEDEQGDEKD